MLRSYCYPEMLDSDTLVVIAVFEYCLDDVGLGHHFLRIAKVEFLS